MPTMSLRLATLILAVLGVAAGAGDRRLLAPGAAQKARQCEWDSSTKTCDAADAVNIMYAVRSAPASAYLSFLLMAHDRQTACDGYRSRGACTGDVANNCVWLDDVLDGPGSSSSKGAASRKGPAAAARVTAPANLFTARMAALQQQFGSSLREMLGRSQDPALDPVHELLAAPAAPAQPAAGAAAAAAASKDSSKQKQGAKKGSSKKTMQCTSKELLENFAFTKVGYSSVLQAPLGLHCPGSKAAALVTCMRQPTKAACAAAPGCVMVPRVRTQGAVDLCVSKHFNSLDTQGMRQFMYGLTLAEPSVVGSCDGACWMRQAKLCSATTDASSCSALSFCRTMGDACVPKLYAQDNFGSSVQEYLGECTEIDNKADCEGRTLSLVNKGAYARWAMPRLASDRCFVPSVGGILGRAPAVNKEGGVRAEALTVMLSAEDERAAAASAAASASAGAAKVAKLLAERGPGALQQLYSTLSDALAD